MLCLLCAVCATASAEKVTALESGYRNIPFTNGYKGFCIDHSLASTTKGNSFAVVGTENASSNIYPDTPIGNYLKILFTQYTDYLFDPDTNISQAIWVFSDG